MSEIDMKPQAKGNSMRSLLFTFFLILVIPFRYVQALPLDPVQVHTVSDFCLSAKSAPEGGKIGWTFEDKVNKVFGSDPVKAGALLYAFQRACRTDLIDLTPTTKYLELLNLLDIARGQYEITGTISPIILKKLEGVGVVKQDIRGGPGKAAGWQLVIDAKTKTDIRIRSAASLASNGYLFIEALHQLSGRPEFRNERKIFLDAIERTANEILKYTDENGDGRNGWGRLWFKGKDGLLLHTTLPGQNMYFGGYTYFPRADASGRPLCEQSLPLKEEAFDHAHNVIFLLESFLVTRDRDLARKIIATVGKSFDDTFDEGGYPKHSGNKGWIYWKQLGKARQSNMEECEVGREIKNTNLRMGLALFAYSQILIRNHDQLKNDHELNFDSSKYLERAKQIIATNNHEIFENNNFGYQGSYSRQIELIQQPFIGRLVYDRTQIIVGLDAILLHDLKNVIADGNSRVNKSLPDKVTICSGSITAPQVDRGVAGSCWNHLAFEAEDYFRIARFTDLWSSDQLPLLQEHLDAISRNLAASKVIHDGQKLVYAHYFPSTVEKGVSNEVVNATYYGFFCMAKNIAKKYHSVITLSSQRHFFESLPGLCSSAPVETSETGVTWRKGYKFYELYLSADRFYVPVDDWLIKDKK
jgi:hypothetical protein